MTPKIATCCYCGTRAALTLGGNVRHELACSSCGAPLHELKMLRTDATGERDRVRPSRRTAHTLGRLPSEKRAKPKKKSTKSLSFRFMEEVWDKAEELFDLFD